MNRKLTAAVAVAMAASTVAIGLRQVPAQEEMSTIRTSAYKAFNASASDLQGLNSLVLDQAYRSGPSAPIPAFDSKSLPSWASSKSALSAARGAAKGKRAWSCVSQAASRSWRYRVPPTIVGRAFDTLSSSTVLLEVINAPNDVPWIGITVSGRILTQPVTP